MAGGTLLLASATFWLGWNTRKERKLSEARELAIGAYNSIRTQVLAWSNLEESYGGVSFDTWRSLKLNQLHLAAQIPKSITTQLAFRNSQALSEG